MFAEKLRAVLVNADAVSVSAMYAPDALLDANVPVWRFQRKGHDEIAEQYAEWTAEGPWQVVGMREWPAPWGTLVEVEQRFVEEGVPVYTRNLHALFVENGKVTRHIMYCSGPWDEALEARQKLEAPMYEP
jgi:hypothetical protein